MAEPNPFERALRAEKAAALVAVILVTCPHGQQSRVSDWAAAMSDKGWVLAAELARVPTPTAATRQAVVEYLAIAARVARETSRAVGRVA
jgi:hypothetical protein